MGVGGGIILFLGLGARFCGAGEGGCRRWARIVASKRFGAAGPAPSNPLPDRSEKRKKISRAPARAAPLPDSTTPYSHPADQRITGILAGRPTLLRVGACEMLVVAGGHVLPAVRIMAANDDFTQLVPTIGSLRLPQNLVHPFSHQLRGPFRTFEGRRFEFAIRDHFASSRYAVVFIPDTSIRRRQRLQFTVSSSSTM